MNFSKVILICFALYNSNFNQKFGEFSFNFNHNQTIDDSEVITSGNNLLDNSLEYQEISQIIIDKINNFFQSISINQQTFFFNLIEEIACFLSDKFEIDFNSNSSTFDDKFIGENFIYIENLVESIFVYFNYFAGNENDYLYENETEPTINEFGSIVINWNNNDEFLFSVVLAQNEYFIVGNESTDFNSTKYENISECKNVVDKLLNSART